MGWAMAEYVLDCHFMWRATAVFYWVAAGFSAAIFVLERKKEDEQSNR